MTPDTPSRSLSIPEEKAALRRQIDAALAALPPARRQALEAGLLDRARALPELNRARRVMAYYPMKDEIDLRPLLRDLLAKGVTVGLPRMHGNSRAMTAHAVADLERDLAPGRFPARQPREDLPEMALEAEDLILVPGRAFDPLGARLGRGGGYYDAFLAASPATRLALAYDEQVVKRVPVEPFDIPVHLLLTPARLLRIRP